MKSIAKWFIHRVTRSLKTLQACEMDQVEFDLRPKFLHGPDQAQGLSFLCRIMYQRRLLCKNILKELRSDIGEKRSHDLTSWAEQGCSCSMPCLTVPAGQANGHAGTNLGAFHRCCDQGGQWVGGASCLYPLGSYARKKKPLITNDRHLVLESAHPSPLSAYRGSFLVPNPFQKPINFERGGTRADWLVKIGERNATISNDLLHWQWERISHVASQIKAQWCPWR